MTLLLRTVTTAELLVRERNSGGYCRGWRETAMLQLLLLLLLLLRWSRD